MSESQKAAIDTSEDWRNYPAVAQVLGPEDSQPLMERMEKNCRRLEEVLASGTPQEQNRARSAMTAYGRTMDLLRRLAQTRDQMMQAK